MHRRALSLSICLTSAAFNWLMLPSVVCAQDVFGSEEDHFISAHDNDATPPPASAFIRPATSSTATTTTSAAGDLTIAETQQITELLNCIAGIDRAQKSLDAHAALKGELEKNKGVKDLYELQSKELQARIALARGESLTGLAALAGRRPSA